MEKVNKAVRDGLETGTYDFEYRIVREDGEERYVEGQGIVTFDADRRPAKMVGTVHDVTERKLAEKKLREAQKRYQDLIEANVDFVWEVDPQGRYTYCSPQMEKLWGLKPEEMLGRTPFDMGPTGRTGPRPSQHSPGCATRPCRPRRGSSTRPGG